MFRPLMIFFTYSCIFLGIPAAAMAAGSEPGAGKATCAAGDRPCILGNLEAVIGGISQDSWRDSAYRELAKTLAFDGNTAGAISLIQKIKNPDTQAMTIRGIGMAYADSKTRTAAMPDFFGALRAEADKIQHPPSHAIALTYIAMAQAFAGDDAGAAATAKSMGNQSLRNKAYGESAEIQAERGDLETALESIAAIDTASYKNKAFLSITRILAQHGDFAKALDASGNITDPSIKAEALQAVLDAQKPRETERETPKKGADAN